MPSKKPAHNPYSRHIFLCRHEHCASSEESDATWQRLLELNKEAGLDLWRNPRRVKCTQAQCLGICGQGPIAVVYPDGVWYHGVNVPAIERIHREHLVDGVP